MERLPDRILLRILSWLDPWDLMALRGCSTRFYSLTQAHDFLWYELDFTNRPISLQQLWKFIRSPAGFAYKVKCLKVQGEIKFSLKLTSNLLTEPFLAKLGELAPHLTQLYIFYADLRNLSLESFQPLRNLSILGLEGSQFSMNFLSSIGTAGLLPYLTGLDLSYAPSVTMHSKGIRALPQRHQLTSLKLAHCYQLTCNFIVELLTKFVGLTDLDLSNSETVVNQTVVEAISNNCHMLESLALAFCPQVTDQGVLPLCSPAGCPKLAKLDLSGCGITDKSLEYVCALKLLRKLILIKTKCSTKAIMIFTTYQPACNVFSDGRAAGGPLWFIPAEPEEPEAMDLN